MVTTRPSIRALGNHENGVIPLSPENAATRIAARVDQDRLWRRLMELGRIGGTGNGGVCRLALTDDEIEARRLLIAWAGEIGLSVHTDDISNLFFSFGRHGIQRPAGRDRFAYRQPADRWQVRRRVRSRGWFRGGPGDAGIWFRACEADRSRRLDERRRLALFARA